MAPPVELYENARPLDNLQRMIRFGFSPCNIIEGKAGKSGKR